jgi:hypothetical protein
LPATIFHAGSIATYLPAFSRVYPVESDALAMNVDRVAVNDRCTSDDIASISRRGEQQGGEEEFHSPILARRSLQRNLERRDA